MRSVALTKLKNLRKQDWNPQRTFTEFIFIFFRRIQGQISFQKTFKVSRNGFCSLSERKFPQLPIIIENLQKQTDEYLRPSSNMPKILHIYLFIFVLCSVLCAARNGKFDLCVILEKKVLR